jgi:hypothetical protein
MYVQPLEGSLSPTLTSPSGSAGAEGSVSGSILSPTVGDNISRFVPPTLNNEGGQSPIYGEGNGSSGYLQGLFGSLTGVLQQLMQMLQSMMGYGCSSPYGSGSCSPYGNGYPSYGNGYASYGSGCPPNGSGNCVYGNERYFQNATGASDGDPHLSFDGTRWNNMASQPDLLSSNSFAGGFRISTQVTPENAKGVSWNQSATISLNNGATTVSMNDNGEASITSYGQSIALAKGQTLQLGDGESVTYEQNGSLTVTAQNDNGGRIQTALTPQGNGVNVDVTAHDVNLGGALVNGYEQRQQGPSPIDWPNPISNPIIQPGPMPTPIGEPTSPISNPIVGLPEPIEEGPQPVY